MDNEKKFSSERIKKITILIIIINIIEFISLILLIIFYLTKKKSKNKILNDEWNDIYGIRIIEIPYYSNNKIVNSFKINGENYDEVIGNINNGKDYSKTDRNYYNIYIPYSSLKNKEKANGIILFIHGGWWKMGNKEDISLYCSRYAKLGYITATMGYTLLNENYKKKSNIFRIIDEITACIHNIKEYLKNLGFNVDKLELAIGGYSAGGHLTLLYGYKIKNSPIPIKFLINIVGPITLEPEYWYKVTNNNTLSSILPDDIENALNNNLLVEVFSDHYEFLKYMNIFLGKKYSDDYLKKMIVNQKIDKNNQNFKSLFKIIQKAYPTYYIDKNSIPTICVYGGNDHVVGFAHYSSLKKLYDQYGVINKLIYMRYGEHDINDYNTEDGIKALKEMNYQILQFTYDYFNQES